jgi:serine/threonine protein phosphatase PrpC
MSHSEELPALRVGARSHTGKVRQENQDRMSRFRFALGEVFIVADGMGGHRGGATAAAMVVAGFEKYLTGVPAGSNPELALQVAAERTNEEICVRAEAGDPSIAHMGSTVVLALLSGRRVLIGHAGDSRAYHFRRGHLTLLTHDHTVVQRLVDRGVLTRQEARHHPEASVLSRALGQHGELAIEVSKPIFLEPGDGILLCSDGLSGFAEDDEILRTLRVQRDAQTAVDALIELALAHGGEDNVTVQLLQFGDRPREEARDASADRVEATPATALDETTPGVAGVVAPPGAQAAAPVAAPAGAQRYEESPTEKFPVVAESVPASAADVDRTVALVVANSEDLTSDEDPTRPLPTVPPHAAQAVGRVPDNPPDEGTGDPNLANPGRGRRLAIPLLATAVLIAGAFVIGYLVGKRGAMPGQAVESGVASEPATSPTATAPASAPTTAESGPREPVAATAVTPATSQPPAPDTLPPSGQAAAGSPRVLVLRLAVDDDVATLKKELSEHAPTAVVRSADAPDPVVARVGRGSVYCRDDTAASCLAVARALAYPHAAMPGELQETYPESDIVVAPRNAPPAQPTPSRQPPR